MMFYCRQLLPQVLMEKKHTDYLSYIPPPRDALSLPHHVLYILAGVALVLVALYAIVGHLITDLMHDLAGAKPCLVFCAVHCPIPSPVDAVLCDNCPKLTFH